MTQYDTVGGVTPQTSILPAGSTKFSRHFPAADPSIPNNTTPIIQFPDLDPGILKAAQVTLTTAQLLALHTTPVSLIPAQGAGTVIEIVSIHAKLVFNSVAYTGSNALEIRYTNGSGAKASADIASTFINSASGTNYNLSKSTGTSIIPVANAAIVAAVPTADPGAGNSPMVLTILYRVITP